MSAGYRGTSDFATFPLPFSNQWSREWLRQDPTSILEKARSRRGMLPEIQEADLRGGTDARLPGESARLQLPLAGAGDVQDADGFRMGDCPPFDSPFNLQDLAACHAPDVHRRRHRGLRPAGGDFRWRSGGSSFPD